MHFAEQILHLLQIVAPLLVLSGKEILHNVAKSFDANAQSMERDLRAVAQSTSVELTGGSPALEREVLEHGASRPDVGGAHRQGLAPLTPLFAVEFLESGAGLVLLLIFAAAKNLKQRVGHGIAAMIRRFRGCCMLDARGMFRLWQRGRRRPSHTCRLTACFVVVEGGEKRCGVEVLCGMW